MSLDEALSDEKALQGRTLLMILGVKMKITYVVNVIPIMWKMNRVCALCVAVFLLGKSKIFYSF